MEQTERFLHKIFHIDTNRINSRGKLRDMNQLEKWHKNGVISIEMSEVAHKECLDSRDSKRFNKTCEYIYTITFPGTAEEQYRMRGIENILFPKGAKNQNERNDVEIVFNATKYSGYLITADGGSKSQPGGLLGHKSELRPLGVIVMADYEAVEWIKNLIARRDKRAINRHLKFGLPLPVWVGKD